MGRLESGCRPASSMCFAAAEPRRVRRPSPSAWRTCRDARRSAGCESCRRPAGASAACRTSHSAGWRASTRDRATRRSRYGGLTRSARTRCTMRSAGKMPEAGAGARGHPGEQIVAAGEKPLAAPIEEMADRQSVEQLRVGDRRRPPHAQARSPGHTVAVLRVVRPPRLVNVPEAEPRHQALDLRRRRQPRTPGSSAPAPNTARYGLSRSISSASLR